MESVNDIKEALSARSRTATLDELRNEGRKRVRLIRAEHVAAMISEAVHSAIEQSGLIAPQEAEKLVEKSRQEFRSILREREQELQRAHDNEEALAEREEQLAQLRAALGERDDELEALRAAFGERDKQLGELRAELAERDSELAEFKDRFEALSQAMAAVRRELEDAHTEIEQQRQAPAEVRLAPAPAPVQVQAVPPAAMAPAAGPSPDLLMSLVNEMANLKANLLHQQQHQQQTVATPAPVPPAAPAAAVPDFSAAFEKLAGTLNDRLEKLGKKMGVSAAVETNAPVDFGGLFKDTGKTLESNMNNIEIKQKAGGGIAANLARLKKLKGGS